MKFTTFLGILLVAGGWIPLDLHAQPPSQALLSSPDNVRIVDLTHPLAPGLPIYPGGAAFNFENMAVWKSGYYLNRFSSGEHTGTHVDAPAHFREGGATVDQLLPDQLIGPIVLIDITSQVKTSPDYELSVNDLLQWEARFGKCPKSAFIVARTGWQSRWNSPSDYLNRDNDGTLHFPGFSHALAEFLVTQRQVNGVGIDTLSTDPGNSKTFPQHRTMLGAGKINLENLANLEPLPPTGAWLMVSPLKIKAGSGAPARIYAFLPAD